MIKDTSLQLGKLSRYLSGRGQIGAETRIIRGMLQIACIPARHLG